MGEFLENERKVGDAIILERAAAVLERRKPEDAQVDEFNAYVAAKAYLQVRARELRQEAESGE